MEVKDSLDTCDRVVPLTGHLLSAVAQLPGMRFLLWLWVALDVCGSAVPETFSARLDISSFAPCTGACRGQWQRRVRKLWWQTLPTDLG